MTSMNEQQAQLFGVALKACEKLLEQFPNDRPLLLTVEQLRAWKQGKSARTAARPAPRRRDIDRAVRPLSEDAAALVRRAELQAQSLLLA